MFLEYLDILKTMVFVWLVVFSLLKTCMRLKYMQTRSKYINNERPQENSGL